MSEWDWRRLLWPSALVVTLLGAWAITYAAGGSRSSFPHLFYLPVLIGAYVGGMRGALLVGLVAGLLMGPAMPLNVEAQRAQSFSNWGLRLAMFWLIGTAAAACFNLLRERLHTIDESHRQAIIALARAVDAKSRYTARHSARVAALAYLLSERLGLVPAEVQRIYLAALVHDVGKIRLPDGVLNKQGPLTDEEWAAIREHPVESHRILREIGFISCIAEIGRHHHERLDGKGYPDGLAGEALSLDVRIVSAADAFEAMTADRPYRAGMSPEQAISEMARCVDTQFDGRVVEHLRQIVDAHPALLAELESLVPSLPDFDTPEPIAGETAGVAGRYLQATKPEPVG